jgi:predicted RNA-binding protein YlxR (DUF448 family)
MKFSHGVTLRSCINCRKRENPMALLRVVCVDGRILPDPDRRAPGRGAWVHLECAVRAVERGAFRWAFRRNDVDGEEVLDYIARIYPHLAPSKAIPVSVLPMSNDEMDAKDMTLK